MNGYHYSVMSFVSGATRADTNVKILSILNQASKQLKLLAEFGNWKKIK